MLSILTALLFGILPIVLKGLLNSLDVITITWFRFGVAALLLAIVVARKKRAISSVSTPGFQASALISCNYRIVWKFRTLPVGIGSLFHPARFRWSFKQRPCSC